MQPEAILKSALYAPDLAAAEAFYTGILGLPVVGRAKGRHVFFRAGAGILLIFNPAATEVPGTGSALPIPVHGARGSGHLCFAASRDEIDRWREVLTSAGIPVESEFDWPGGGRSLYFRDPAGNSLEFAEPRIWD